jgi:MFS transporter, UMF1 family
VALLAPLTGVLVEAPQRRRIALSLLTGGVVVLTSAMSLIRPDYHYLWAGLALFAMVAACSDLATVPFNAMLRQLSTPETSGRISGLGSAAGYFGSVLLLLLVYFGLIAGDGDTRGFLGIPAADGQNVRVAMLVAAAWLLLFALPLLLNPPASHIRTKVERVGLIGGYRKLWAEVRGEWERDRNVVWYLIASAVFRDGLTGVYTFGAVLGVSVYGISAANILLFGVCASAVAAIGAVVGGLLDDRVGSKAVIIGALTLMIVAAVTLLALSGPGAFWIFGLMLCLFIGPTQASARTLMLRLSADGKEGVAFGLYTTAGRAAAFLAPWLFFTFIDIFGTDRAGMGGLIVVLVAGLVLMLFVSAPHRSSKATVTSVSTTT